MCQFIRIAFGREEFDKSLNHSLISLLPKEASPSYITQFRLIALSNVLVKIIRKVVAKRLKVLLPKLTSEEQRNFVPRRHIPDNIIIT